MSPQVTADLAFLTQKFAKLIDIASRIPMTPDAAWKNHGQVLLIKIFRHLESIQLLSEGIETKLNGSCLPRYVDYGSMAVLARTAYETYVMFYFIFCDGSSKEKELRYRVWRMSGLIGRQKIHGPMIPSPIIQAQLASEKIEIEHLKQLIKEDSGFRALPDKVQGNVLKGDNVRLGKPLIDLAENAGLPRKYTADMYNHLCNYSHSGAISAFQMHDSFSDPEGVSLLAGTTTSFCTILLSQMLLAYTELFDEVDAAYVMDEELCNLVARWIYLKNSLGSMYGKIEQK